MLTSNEPPRGAICEIVRFVNAELRPPESANVGADLRTRLEGRVETLEDGIHLLDSVTATLNREDFSDDDLATLHEAVLQLPRLNEALEAALKHDELGPLTRKFAERTRWVQDALSLKLKATPPSLRAGLSDVLAKAKLAARPPRDGETQLMTDTPPARGMAVLFGAVFALIFAGLVRDAAALWIAPIAMFIASKVMRKTPEWTLLPDRLHFADRGDDARDLAPSTIDGLSVTRGFVMIRRGENTKLVPSREPRRLLAWLELLRSNWLSNLESTPVPFALSPARDRTTNTEGVALIGREGVLFIAKARESLFMKSFTRAPLSDAPPFESVHALITHVPEGRWNGLGQHLAHSCDAVWLHKSELKLDDSSAERLVVNERIELTGSRDPITNLLR